MTRGIVKIFTRSAYQAMVLAAQGFAQLCKRAANRFSLVFADQLFSAFRKRFLSRAHYNVGFVARFNQLALVYVFFRELHRIHQHLFDLLVGEPIRRLHLDGMFLTHSLVSRGSSQYPVRLNQEFNFDAPEPGRLRLYALERKFCEAAAIRSHLALALNDVNINARLVINPCSEHLRSGSGYGRVAIDYLRHYSAHRLYAAA